MARGRGRLRLHRAPTGSPPTATSRTRSARTGSRSPRRITRIPFYVVAPTSTLDPTPRPARTSRSRSATRREVSARFPARNPAFDVTPAELVTAIVTEVGVHRAPYAASLPDARAQRDRDRRRSRDRGGARALRVRRAALRVAARAGCGGRALPRVERRPRARSSRRATTTSRRCPTPGDARYEDARRRGARRARAGRGRAGRARRRHGDAFRRRRQGGAHGGRRQELPRGEARADRERSSARSACVGSRGADDELRDRRGDPRARRRARARRSARLQPVRLAPARGVGRALP